MKLSLKNNDAKSVNGSWGQAAVRRCRPLLGTFVEITAFSADHQQAGAAIDAAFAAIERVQQLMSFHAADSDVSRLNRLAAREDVCVSPETYEVLTRAKELHERTDGIFDVAVAPELFERKLLPRHAFLTDKKDYPGRTADIVLGKDNVIRFLRPLCIDLGGIAKGFAVDQAAEALKKNGIKSAVVNAGGDLRCFGEKEQPVWVRHPQNPERLLALPALKNAALATSAHSYRSGPVRASSLHVDGRTRKSVHRRFSVSVRADSCLLADALTKVVMAAGEGSASLITGFSAAVFIVYPDNRVMCYEGKNA